MKTTTIVSFFLALIISACLPAAELASPSIQLNARLVDKSDSKVVVEFGLTNTSAYALEMYAADLPWGVQTSIVLLAAQVQGDRKIIQDSPYIDDPGPTKISIKPSEQIVGTIELARRFPKLPRIAMKNEVILFWSYQAKTIAGRRSNRTSGGLALTEHSHANP
jgi:hypothetical protein